MKQVLACHFMLLVGLAFAVSARALSAQPTPVSGQDPTDHSLCNLARADYLGLHDTEAIRSQPSKKSPEIGQMRRGEIVYICNDTGRNGGWFQIFYKDKTHICGPVIKDGPVWKQGLPFENARTCASGWVPQKFINVLSG